MIFIPSKNEAWYIDRKIARLTRNSIVFIMNHWTRQWITDHEAEQWTKEKKRKKTRNRTVSTVISLYISCIAI